VRIELEIKRRSSIDLVKDMLELALLIALIEYLAML